MPANILVEQNTLTFENKTYRCAIGKNGITTNKHEGDLATPAGAFALRECFYRKDRIAVPETALPQHAITKEDGWCDDPKSPIYNHHFTFSSYEEAHMPASFEQLWRDDHVYDVIVPLGYNDSPPIPGKGSAIFFHIAHADYRGTEGCVAVALTDMLEILQHCNEKTMIIIR